jgi:hypothetical protein
MKFIIGLFIGCLFTTIAAVVIQKNPKRIVLSDTSNIDQVMLVKADDDYGTKFSVFREDDELFQIDIGSNAFSFEVKGNGISILRFQELIQQGETTYNLWAERTEEGKHLTQITYDMKSGLPSQIAKSSGSGIQVYDGKGNLLLNQSEPVDSEQ